MRTRTDLIALRINSLPMNSGERAKALAFVAAGEAIADLLLSIGSWFRFPRARFAALG